MAFYKGHSAAELVAILAVLALILTVSLNAGTCSGFGDLRQSIVRSLYLCGLVRTGVVDSSAGNRNCGGKDYIFILTL